MKGIYILILKLNSHMGLTIGKLGKFHFKSGYYYYVGSALGGFKRVTRHFNVSSGINSTRKWHIDYLLPHSEVVCAVLLPTNETLECKLAEALAESEESITGFGCSDCACKTHLFFSDKDIRKEIRKTAGKVTGNESIIIYPGI